MKRRRVKIKGKEEGCNSVFNSDYRLMHNREQHGGRIVPFETLDAVKDPFEASMRRKEFLSRE